MYKLNQTELQFSCYIVVINASDLDHFVSRFLSDSTLDKNVNVSLSLTIHCISTETIFFSFSKDEHIFSTPQVSTIVVCTNTIPNCLHIMDKNHYCYRHSVVQNSNLKWHMLPYTYSCTKVKASTNNAVITDIQMHKI
jgi:hypothetical protein